MTPSTRKKGIVTSLGVLAAVATLLSGGVTTAYANDALANPNSAMGYPSFKGAADPIPGTGVAFDPSTSYLKQVFDADVANGAGTDTAHDFWIDKMLTRKRYRHQRCWRLQLCGRRQERIPVLTWPCRIHVHAYAGSTWFRRRCRILGSDRQRRLYR